MDSTHHEPSRRQFVGRGLAALAAAPLTAKRIFAGSSTKRLRVLSIGVVGTIGRTDRRRIASHPDAEIVGLCDVDERALAQARKEHPNAFVELDYREAFAKHADEFDAVIVATPDHSHAPIMLTALAHDKHVYGQKPLVQQLEELSAMERMLAAKPHLVTQLGNQRMAYPGRRAAVEILRRDLLGPAIEAYAWTAAPNRGRYFNFDRVLHEPSDPPPGLHWDLWLGPCAEAPYREGLAPVVWRSWWEYGTGGLGDWGCHVLDVILFAYDELRSPFSVLTHCPEPAGPHFHVFPCRSTITYHVDSPRFARTTFAIHYADRGQAPSRAALGLPAGAWPDRNTTVVVCEDGTLVLGANGKLEIHQQGEVLDGRRLPGLPPFPKMDHWHSWVDRCLGRDVQVRTPFEDAVRITEPCLLAVKATRFPGQELLWDRSKLAFSNHARATAEIVRRRYREGFAPPAPR